MANTRCPKSVILSRRRRIPLNLVDQKLPQHQRMGFFASLRMTDSCWQFVTNTNYQVFWIRSPILTRLVHLYQAILWLTFFCYTRTYHVTPCHHLPRHFQSAREMLQAVWDRAMTIIA